jgi:beta-lactam-binding protein with PASTA domain
VFKFITHRPLWANMLVGFALAIILFFILILSLKWCTHHNESKTIPSVVGKSYYEAEEILTKAGFDVRIQDSIYSDTSKPMMVIRQLPDADEVVKINRIVFLTINRAIAPMIEMPNLVGKSKRAAEMMLANAGLKLGDISYRSNFAGGDAVLEQNYNGSKIAPNMKIRMASTIDLVLSNGVGDTPFAVPSLIGMTFCDAKKLLHANNLDFEVVIADQDVRDTCNAYIYWQSPERFDDDGKIRNIRAGQMMDVRVRVEKPEAQLPDPVNTEPPTQ